MPEPQYVPQKYGVKKRDADTGLIKADSIVFGAGDNLTTEKKSEAISLTEPIHPDAIFLLAIDKPIEDTAKDLTVNTYNMIKIDGVNLRDVLHTTHTVEMVTGAATQRDFLVQGLFTGEGQIKLGMKFAADSGAITVYYKLYRL